MSNLDQVSDLSMAKDLRDLTQVTRPLDSLTDEEVKRVQRFVTRLATIGQSESDIWFLRSLVAEQIWFIHAEQDFTLFNGPDGQPLTWVEVRERLADAVKLSPSTLSHYIRMVRLGREVFVFQDGDFANERGIVTMQHIIDVAKGIDGRDSQNFAITIAPRTEEFKAYLERMLPGATYVEQFQRYYQEEVRWELLDDTAINKPPKELAAQARDRLGAPSIKAKRIYGSGGSVCGYTITLGVNDEMKTFTLEFKEPFIPDSVLDWLNKALL